MGKIAGSGQGVEQTYTQLTGNVISGEDISQLFQTGDSIAIQIYDAAVHVAATGIVGMASVQLPKDSSGSMLDPEKTQIIIHGGLFKTPGLSQRMEAILGKHVGYEPHILYTHHLTHNACLDGAALLGFI